jgi:hypothetical protein
LECRRILGGKVRNLLLSMILKEREVFLLQPRDDSPAAVSNRHRNEH